MITGEMDINAPGSDKPDVLQSTGQTISVKEGDPVAINVSITHIWNHCCFAGSDHAGTVLIPPNVTITLIKI